jgi:hypothetical protein
MDEPNVASKPDSAGTVGLTAAIALARVDVSRAMVWLALWLILPRRALEEERGARWTSVSAKTS